MGRRTRTMRTVGVSIRRTRRRYLPEHDADERGVCGVQRVFLQMNRVATTLINGEIYLGFASHGDDGPYYGWLLGYSASTLANNMAFVTVPNFESFGTVSGDRSDFIAQAGFWNAGSTISTDGTYLYISSGNGAFNPNTTNFNSTYTSIDSGPSGNHTVQMPLDDDYGDAVLKLKLDLERQPEQYQLGDGCDSQSEWELRSGRGLRCEWIRSGGGGLLYAIERV